MTKAELLHRFRYLILILPLATAAGFRLMLFLWRQTATGELAAPLPVQTALALFYDFAEPAVMGWLVLTLASSVANAYTITAGPDGNIRGTLGIVLLFVLTWLLIGMHLAVSVILFMPSH